MKTNLKISKLVTGGMRKNPKIIQPSKRAARSVNYLLTMIFFLSNSLLIQIYSTHKTTFDFSEALPDVSIKCHVALDVGQ